jgi:predicted nuclease of predicted toxin-antitoxin system
VKLLADEGIDRQIVDRLRHDGYSVLYIAEMNPGIADEMVLDTANQEGALLITADKDFGELIFRQQRLTSGVILIRLAGLLPLKKAEIVTTAIKQHLAELPNAFAVITSKTIRVRPGKQSITPDV